jgi:hypothetical protein
MREIGSVLPFESAWDILKAREADPLALQKENHGDVRQA